MDHNTLKNIDEERSYYRKKTMEMNKNESKIFT